MRRPDGDAARLTPQESWQAVHSTVDRTRNAMYVAGMTPITLLWGAIVSLGMFAHYAIDAYAPEFASANPWLAAPLWAALAAAGMMGSALIGHRATNRIAQGETVRGAGVRVFLFWLAVVAAALLIPAAAGMWNADASAYVPRVTIGIIALGYVLFGIMHRPAIAAVGVGIGLAYYVPSYLAGEAAPLVAALAILAVVALGAAWTRRSDAP